MKILGEIINVAAKIYSLQGFSAHADQTGLLDWVSHFTTKPQRLFVVHGEAPASRTLAGLIEQKFAIPTVIPQMGEEYVLMPTGVELTRVAAAFPAAAANTRQQLLLALTRLEQKIAALKEQLLLHGRANGEEAVLEKLIQDIEDKIDEAEQKAANK